MRALLAGLADAGEETHPTPERGAQHRLKGATRAGSALEVDGKLIHSAMLAR